MKIKKEIERSKRAIPLYVIHNLKTYTSVEQVQNYIKNTLLKSVTFTLELGHDINTKIGSKNGVYFSEKNEEPQKIFHLIFANENSEAGKYYNQYTLDFIENSYLLINNLKSYDVIESIKERYIEVSKEIIEKNEKNEKNEIITKESFDNSNPKLIKLINAKEITLKKCFIDELGFSNLKPNGFEPKYNIFKKDNKIIIRVEIPGNCKIQVEKSYADNYNIIKLNGEKTKDSEPKTLEDNIFNIREFGKFYLEIPVSKEFNLSKEDPSYIQKDGLAMFEYKLVEKEKPMILPPNNNI
jgi:HSP20 family molecular chaperone IbpA